MSPSILVKGYSAHLVGFPALNQSMPSASSEATEEEPPQQIRITIDASGKLYVNERELIAQDAQTLRRELQKLADGRTDLPVLVSGDRQAPLQAMMTVMDVAAQLEMAHLSFVARRDDGANGGE